MKKTKKGEHNVSGKQDTRPTIAYLTPEAVIDSTQMSLWAGVEAGAGEQDLNLIAFPGGNIHSSTRGQANIVYDLITPETFAGLITWASALGHLVDQNKFMSEKELSALHARYHPLPIVTLSKAVPGHPVVLVESEQGMRDAVTHLIEEHGIRRIAFIRGPEAHPLAEARYRAYLDALTDHGNGVNDDMATPPGNFSREHGAWAVDLFLDERNLRPKEDLEAIVAASDLMALGAMDTLQRRDIRVPEDVAVVGFNNSPGARFASPAITSVAVPFREQGMRAVQALKRMLEGESVPDEILVPSRLTIHQSCGCLDATVAQAGTFSSEVGEGLSLKEAFVTRREVIVREMAQVMDALEAPAWAERVLDGFILDLGGSQPGEFLTALREALRGATQVDRDLPAWQNMLSVLQRHMVSGVDFQKALLLIGQARTMLGETASRASAQQQLQVEGRVQTLQGFSLDLVATFEVERLMDVLAEGLPTLDIPSCYLALYEDPQPYEYPQPVPEWSRLILAYDENGRVALEPGGKRFPTRHLVPEGMLPAHRRYTMVLQPLYLQDSQIGFALFEVGPQDWSVYEVLRGEIASALHGAQLTEQTARRAVQLQTAAEVSEATSSILDPDELIQRVVELVQERFNLYYAGLFTVEEASSIGESGGQWAVLRAGTGEAGRQMLARGHKLEIGGGSMVSWCIVNKQARIALDVGEDAVRFENPFLPETRSELALPLVSRGEAIGALSIQSSEETAFSEEDVSVLQTMADQVANAIANARLYSEARRERGLLQALLDNSPDYIFFKDRESRFIRTNKAHAQNLLGVSDPREVEGKTDFDLFPGEEEDTQRFYDEEQELMETGEPVVGREWTVPSQATGEDVWLSEHKIPILGETGEAVGLIGIGRDVTARKRAEGALERRAVQLQTVAEVGREAAVILDVRQLLELTVNRVSEGFGFYHTGIFLLDELGQHAVLRAASSEGGQRMLERGHSLLVGQVGVVGHAAAANEPHIALDVGEDAVFFDNPDLPETRSEMALPLSIRGEVIGVLDVQSGEPAAFAEEDVAILRILADQLAVAIQNARLVERTEEQLRELNLLYGQFSAETWERLLSAGRPMGYVYDRIDVLPSDELPSPAFDLAVERNKVVELDASEESGSVLAVPLRVRGQVIGSLGVEAGDGRGWTPEEITLIEAVSQQVAQAIDGARLFAEAQKTALSMESLYQTSRAISSSLEEEEMIRAVLEAVYRTLNCEQVLLNTVNEEKGTIGLQHGIWEGEFDIYPEWKGMHQYSLDDADIVPDIYRSGRTEIITEWDDRFDREMWERFGHEYFLHIFMPINLRERVIGVIEVAFDKRRKDRISDDEVQMLSAFMDQAAVALENVRLFDQVQRRARREHRIYEIANRLRRSPDISTILQTAVDELGQALQVDRAMVHLRVKPRTERAVAEEAARADGQEQPVES